MILLKYVIKSIFKIDKFLASFYFTKIYKKVANYTCNFFLIMLLLLWSKFTPLVNLKIVAYNF